MRAQQCIRALAAAIIAGGLISACGGGSSPAEDDSTDDSAASDLVAQAAVADELAGVPEDRAYLRRSLRDEPQVCGEPEPRMDERAAIERRGFVQAEGDGSAMVEIRQDTTAYRDAESAEAYVAESHALLRGCTETVEAGQVTRDYTEIPMPADLEGEAIAANMTIEDAETEFAHRHGCVSRGAVVQCTRVWAGDDDDADEYFADAITEGAASLESVTSG